MANITALLTVVVALSMASERIIELLKKFFPGIAQACPTNEGESRRQATVQLAAALLGTLIARISHDQIAAMLPANLAQFLGWPAYGLLGLMSSAGSQFWNHILDALRAMKIEKEAKAELRIAELNASRKLASKETFSKSAIAA